MFPRKVFAHNLKLGLLVTRLHNHWPSLCMISGTRWIIPATLAGRLQGPIQLTQLKANYLLQMELQDIQWGRSIK